MGYPKTSDGRHIFQQSKFRGDVDPYLCGAGDHVTNGKGQGPEFNSATGVSGDDTVSWSFNDWVYIGAGGLDWTGGEPGDTIDLWIDAPATTVVANAGNGNCNLTDLGGYNLITPAGGDGSHDYSDPVPVPSATETGYWKWDEPDEGLGTISAGTPAKSVYNLLDVEVKLVHWVCKLPLIGGGALSIDPQTKARKILPHWEWNALIHNSGNANLKVGWHLNLARKKTT